MVKVLLPLHQPYGEITAAFTIIVLLSTALICVNHNSKYCYMAITLSAFTYARHIKHSYDCVYHAFGWNAYYHCFNIEYSVSSLSDCNYRYHHLKNSQQHVLHLSVKIPGRRLLKAELAERKVPQGKFRRYKVAEGSRVWPFAGPQAAEEGCVTETGVWRTLLRFHVPCPLLCDIVFLGNRFL